MHVYRSATNIKWNVLHYFLLTKTIHKAQKKDEDMSQNVQSSDKMIWFKLKWYKWTGLFMPLWQKREKSLRHGQNEIFEDVMSFGKHCLTHIFAIFLQFPVQTTKRLILKIIY